MPDSNYSDAYVWLSRPEGSIELVRLPTGDRKGEWVFSRQTVRSIDRLYDAFEDRPYHAMLLTVSVDRLRPDLWRAPELWLRERTPAWAKFEPVARRRPSAPKLYQLLGCVVLARAGLRREPPGVARCSRSPPAESWLSAAGNCRPPRCCKHMRPAGWLLGLPGAARRRPRRWTWTSRCSAPC